MYTIVLIVLFLLAIFFGYKSLQATHRIKSVTRQCEEVSFLLENVNDGIIEYDSSYKVLRINKRAEILIGVKAHDIVGKKVELGADHSKATTLTRITYPSFGDNEEHIEAPDGGSGQNLTIDTYEVITDSPAKRKYKIFTVPKTSADSNKPIGIIKIVRDITREDIISHSKSDLVAVAAHQLRSPLANAKWIFGALLDGDYGTLTDKQKELLTQGALTNEGLVKIVDDILDLSKIEAASFDYTLTKQNIVTFIRDTVKSLEAKARAANVALLTDLAELPPEKVEFTFDAIRMRMVLINLIDNAISYSRLGSSVAISLKTRDGQAEISVRDLGIGIPKDAQAKLFSKFYRAENAKKTKTHGTGLGLFLAKTIVESHGGSISYITEENKGTTFTITLPRVAAVMSDLGRYENADGKKAVAYGL